MISLDEFVCIFKIIVFVVCASLSILSSVLSSSLLFFCSKSFDIFLQLIDDDFLTFIDDFTFIIIIWWNKCDFTCIWLNSVSFVSFIWWYCWWIWWCESDPRTVCDSTIFICEKFCVLVIFSGVKNVSLLFCKSYLASLAWKFAPTEILLGLRKSHSTWKAASPVVTSSGSCWTTITFE